MTRTSAFERFIAREALPCDVAVAMPVSSACVESLTSSLHLVMLREGDGIATTHLLNKLEAGHHGRVVSHFYA